MTIVLATNSDTLRLVKSLGKMEVEPWFDAALPESFFAKEPRTFAAWALSRYLSSPKGSVSSPSYRGGFSSRRGMETIGVHLCWGSWRTANPLGMMRRIIHRKLTSA
jgi:hypothetical protein